MRDALKNKYALLWRKPQELPRTCSCVFADDSDHEVTAAQTLSDKKLLVLKARWGGLQHDDVEKIIAFAPTKIVCTAARCPTTTVGQIAAPEPLNVNDALAARPRN